MENVRGKGPHIRSSQDWASASRQGKSTHGFLPSAVRNGKQLGVGPTLSALVTSDVLFFPNMKTQLTERFGFIAKIKS
jgi:hypothetical protein